MRASADLRLGIDVGGTNTDAVILDRGNRLLAKFKTPTTEDLTTGIGAAIEAVAAILAEPRSRITHVMLGTTHATNAILERRSLLRVAVVRLGAPATLSVPPLFGWPDDLRAAISAGTAIVGGGHELTGVELAAFDEPALRDFLESVAPAAEAVSITGVFSPVSMDHEERAAEVVRQVLGDLPISLSGRIGSFGLLERENACVLNSALAGVADLVVDGLHRALARNGIDAVAYLAQNDGTLMGLDYVRRFPVLTIGSGPANSMRGAAFLTDVQDAVVIDVGGTSSDIGILASGFPRESAQPVDIGGVTTNFRMPDLISVAIGGGTVVRDDSGATTVGPDSVGYRLREHALVFGGTTPTLTDAAVAARRMDVGDVRPEGVDGVLARALAIADEAISSATDQMKSSRQSLPLIAVGGGSPILPGSIPGVDPILRPDHHDVTNAIGAAIAFVSGHVDRVYKLGELTREQARAEAIAAALDEAIAAGASPDAVEIVDVEDVPMAYLTEPVVRIRAKAAGPLDTV